MRTYTRVFTLLVLVGSAHGCNGEADAPAPPPDRVGDTATQVDTTADATTPADLPPSSDPGPDAEDAGEQPETSAPPEPWRIEPELDLTQYVDPRIGTDGAGNVIPGALLPHGMIRVSPDTNEDEGGIDAYDWGDPRIEGITHTHLEGPGGSLHGYSQILVLPLVGPPRADYATPFSHDDESMSPGYYRVTLEGGAKVELTASRRSGIHRYTFPDQKDLEAWVLLDLGHSNGVSTGPG